MKRALIIAAISAVHFGVAYIVLHLAATRGGWANSALDLLHFPLLLAARHGLWDDKLNGWGWGILNSVLWGIAIYGFVALIFLRRRPAPA